MAHLYFTRHGQTVWNVQNKVCGATDVELTGLGHNQAIELGKEILNKNIKIDEILHSPLIRARETARHISEITGIPMREEPRLKEQNFGKYEATEVDGEAIMNAKLEFVTDYEGGESMMRLAQRVYNLLDDIRKESDNKTYLLVAHNGIARVVNSYFNNMSNREYAEFRMQNCEIKEYIWKK